MGKNDILLLDGIIDERIEIGLPSAIRDEAFEYFAFEQTLKDLALSKEEILSGSVDGRQDGGIDGIFISINGHLLQDPSQFYWPKSGCDLNVTVITCKHHETFKQATLDALVATFTELFEFAIEDGDLKGAYSSALLAHRERLRLALRKLSPRLRSFEFRTIYASRGTTTDIGIEVKARATQLVEVLRNYFGSRAKVQLDFVGSSELIDLHRKTPAETLELPFVEVLAKGERYVVLTTLSDYFKFISDNGALRRYIFDSNVRDFMGLNRVNDDIRSTLSNVNSPDFWWLNNGVTILATSASIIGKSIQATNVQIVNGLQTTESIYRHFSISEREADDRCVLVKLIVTKDVSVRDAIIRATNNQTDVELSSLRATDKVQRDIEEHLFRNGLYYERRKNYYVNQGHPVSEIVTPLYLAAGFIAIVKKSPERAVALKSKFMKSKDTYESVFSDRVPLGVWCNIANVMRNADCELEKLRPHGRETTRFLKNWRYLVAFLLVSRFTGKFTYSIHEFMLLSPDLFNKTEVVEVWHALAEIASTTEKTKVWTGRRVTMACESYAKKHGIKGIESIDGYKHLQSLRASKLRGPDGQVTQEFIDEVRDALPSQPWKPGMHVSILDKLNCSKADFYAAVRKLVKAGVFHFQQKGVVYDEAGNVLKIDTERVDPETLKLR